MSAGPTPKDLDDDYVKLLAAITAEVRAGKLDADEAVDRVRQLEEDWRKTRYDVVQQGFARMIAEYEAAGDPATVGIIAILKDFRDDPKTPMLRRHCDCGGRLIERSGVDAPEDDSPLVKWRCVECASLYDVTGNRRGKDPRR